MTHGVKYFAWRGGRPRWIPGPNLRERGARGTDLKGADGSWLPLADALVAAGALNDRFVVAPHGARVTKRTRRPAREGYVYFIVVGEHIKIGFSADPGARFKSLDTGFPVSPGLMLAVLGTADEEKRLHHMFAADRFRGEWFKGSRALLNVIVRSAQLRRVSFGTSGLRPG